jgi:hypothetical protein
MSLAPACMQGRIIDLTRRIHRQRCILRRWHSQRSTAEDRSEIVMYMYDMFDVAINRRWRCVERTAANTHHLSRRVVHGRAASRVRSSRHQRLAAEDANSVACAFVGAASHSHAARLVSNRVSHRPHVHRWYRAWCTHATDPMPMQSNSCDCVSPIGTMSLQLMS